MSGNSDRLREYLAERDAPCPGCGYNLRGLAGEACPECGQSAWSVLAPTRRRLTAPERAVLAGIGFALAGIAGVALVVWRERVKDPLNILAMWVPAAMLIVLIVPVGVWFDVRLIARRRSWLASLSAAGFVVLGGAYFLLFLVLLVGTL